MQKGNDFKPVLLSRKRGLVLKENRSSRLKIVAPVRNWTKAAEENQSSSKINSAVQGGVGGGGEPLGGKVN